MSSLSVKMSYPPFLMDVIIPADSMVVNIAWIVLGGKDAQDP